jgi:hypothetical protein
MFRHIVRFRSGAALAGGILVAGLAACGPASVQDEVVAKQVDALEGGTLVVGEAGVVEFDGFFPNNKGGSCTGTMIDQNTIVTAAHCFKDAGSGSSAWTGMANFRIFYHDPKNGRRRVYPSADQGPDGVVGPATWFAYPTYDSSKQGDAGAANSDMALIRTPVPLELTDYHDYMRLYADIQGPISSGSLWAFGAGIYNDRGADDAHLRKASYHVQNVEDDHVVVDQDDDHHVCHGDSGGPLVKYATQAGASIPLLVGDLAQSEGLNVPVPLPGGGKVIIGGGACYSPTLWRDDSFYSRINKFSWIQSITGVNCSSHAGSLRYRRCFSLPFINDVSNEGGLERGLATALFTVASL